MQKCNEVIKGWKNQCDNPFKYVFNIQIDKKDFDEMVKEMGEVQDRLKEINELVIGFYSEGEDFKRLPDSLHTIADQLQLISRLSKI